MKKSNDSLAAQTTTLEQQALSHLEKNGETTVALLYNALKLKNPTLSEMEVTDLAWRLAHENRVNLDDVPPALKSIREYVRLWDRNFWFYFAIAISLMTVLAVYATPADLPFVAVRWILGSIFVLFVPGYVTVEALFPKGRELDNIERFALSVGLSLAFVPLIGLLLNYTPWGIRLTPILISLALFTIVVAVAGVVRRFRLAAERFELESSQ